MSDAAPKSPSRSGTILRVFGTLATLALLGYLLSKQGWDEIVIAIRQIPPWRIGFAFLLMIVSRISVAARWHVLLRSAGTKTSFWESLRITFAGLFASNFLPTTIGGDVVRLAGAVQLKIDAALGAASLIVDRLVGMTGMAMAVPFGLTGFLNVLNSADQISNAPIIAAALPVRKWRQTAWNKTKAVFQRVTGALAIWLKQPRALLLALAFSWIHMICLFVIIQQLLIGMGEDISVWIIAGLYALVYFITLLPVSVVNNSLTSALLFRTLMMVASLPGAIFVPGMLAPNKQQLDENKTS